MCYFSLLVTWSNAWTAARRFQSNAQVRFAHDCQGDGSIEHYSVCFMTRTGVRGIQNNLESFLLIGERAEQQCIKLACQTYAAKRVTDHGGRTKPCGSQRELVNWTELQYKIACMHCKGLADELSAAFQGQHVPLGWSLTDQL